MIQTRLGNEQFNSLPNLIPNERSHTGFITTDRPDSSQLVDLHVYIIPKNVWKDVQHLAQNEAMDDAVSAGFVHVSPNMKICDLRQSIDQLCGTENYFPRDFIFLRSVGRCLTRVKPRQERELKVKNYRPPQTFAPEIYLLEGRHEDYAHIPSASPALSSASYVFGSRTQNNVNYEDDDRSPSKLRHYNHKPLRGGKHFLPAVHPNGLTSHLPSSGRQSWAKFTQIGSDVDESSAKEQSKLKEEQERLRRRQAELERMRRAAEEKKARSEREDEDRRRQQQAQADLEEERRRRQIEAERRRLEQDRAEGERRRLEQERAEAERRLRLEQEAAATKIQASYRGFKDRRTIRERKQRIELEKREGEAKRRRQLEEEEQKRKAKEIEEQRRRELAKRQREDPETLRTRLQELRNRRAELERIREEVIRHLKNIHNRITLRRKEARDMWKKKYFHEKKKTPPLEERIVFLKDELEQIHKRTIQNIDGETKHAIQMGYTKEAEVGNFVGQITRSHHEIQDIRHQVEQAKLRLTTDVKLRNQAENECRSLRHELNQAKMNMNHIKTRV